MNKHTLTRIQYVLTHRLRHQYARSPMARGSVFLKARNVKSKYETQAAWTSVFFVWKLKQEIFDKRSAKWDDWRDSANYVPRDRVHVWIFGWILSGGCLSKLKGEGSYLTDVLTTKNYISMKMFSKIIFFYSPLSFVNNFQFFLTLCYILIREITDENKPGLSKLTR